MAKAGVRLVRESGRVFLEAAPRGLDPAAVQSALTGVDGVVEVHELHLWEVTSGFPALSAHVLVDSARNCHAGRQQLEALLAEQFGVTHTTLQVDHREDLLLPTRQPSAGGHAGHAHQPGGER